MSPEYEAIVIVYLAAALIVKRAVFPASAETATFV